MVSKFAANDDLLNRAVDETRKFTADTPEARACVEPLVATLFPEYATSRALASHVRERMIDRDRRAFVVENMVRRSIWGPLDDEEYRKAAQTAMEYDDWSTTFTTPRNSSAASTR